MNFNLCKYLGTSQRDWDPNRIRVEDIRTIPDFCQIVGNLNPIMK